MFVAKRDGRSEEVKFDKITARIKKLCYGLNDKYVDPGTSTAASPAAVSARFFDLILLQFRLPRR